MLKPIHYVPCAPALRACRRLQEHLLAWLCDPAIGAGDVTQANLQPPRMPTQIEADWLWGFLLREMGRRPLLERAQALAAMPVNEKVELTSWCQTVSAIAGQFQPNPPAWPQTKPAIHVTAWNAFKELMEAFYEKGLNSTNGIPYLADGTPTAGSGVTYAQFVQEFRDAHRLNLTPGAREICVLCGGSHGDTPHVDHWIIKSAFPLLSVCADNLQLICSTCNEAPNKGDKPVHTAGNFSDWFHPYLRHTNGAIRLDYNLQELSIKVVANAASDAPKVARLDKLLNLETRWNREFKAEYTKQQSVLIGREKRRIARGDTRHTQAEVQAHLQAVQDDLMPTEPHYEVRNVLCAAMLDHARLASWRVELELQ